MFGNQGQDGKSLMAGQGCILGVAIVILVASFWLAWKLTKWTLKGVWQIILGLCWIVRSGYRFLKDRHEQRHQNA